jgi:hypothetical protein
MRVARAALHYARTIFIANNQGARTLRWTV